MKKVAILGLHLGYGGVEQVIVNVANMLCEEYDVELVITYKVLDEIPYKLNEKVKIKYLTNLKPNKEEFKKKLRERKIVKVFKEGLKSLYILKQRTSVVKKYIKNSDANILISSRVLYTKLVGKFAKKNVVTIAQEHCHHNNNKKYIKKVVNACKNIDYFIPVSRELTEFYKNSIKNNKTKCLFIPNSLEFWPDRKSDLTEKNIISIGRFSKEKGFPDLIRVFNCVHKNHPEWKLHLIGDGDEMPLVKQIINEFDLNNHVILHGFQNKNFIYKKLFESSIYVMCSYEESFGIVLVEAASVGIPILAFSSAQGAHEIIENGKNGYLISDRDISKMVDKIDMLITDKEKRLKFGSYAKKSVKQYSFESVKQKWLEFLSNI